MARFSIFNGGRSRHFLRDTTAATPIEYTIAVAVVALVVVAGADRFGGALKSQLFDITSKIDAAKPAAGGESGKTDGANKEFRAN